MARKTKQSPHPDYEYIGRLEEEIFGQRYEHAGMPKPPKALITRDVHHVGFGEIPPWSTPESLKDGSHNG